MNLKKYNITKKYYLENFKIFIKKKYYCIN